MQTLADIMIGSPGETAQDIERTLSFVQQLQPDYLHCSITTPYPGTLLYQKALVRGAFGYDLWQEFASAPAKEFTSPVLSEYFSREDLKRYISRIYRKFYLSFGFLRREMAALRSVKEFFCRAAAATSLL
jgi:radical SAM superfamily enzyme YgiQ (UPF0313 family)